MLISGLFLLIQILGRFFVIDIGIENAYLISGSIMNEWTNEAAERSSS